MLSNISMYIGYILIKVVACNMIFFFRKKLKNKTQYTKIEKKRTEIQSVRTYIKKLSKTL